jgi:integrase
MDVLRPLLDYAVRYGYVTSNPFRERYIMPSKSTIAGRDKGIWTLQELGEVWRSVRGEWYEGAYLLSAFGGLRVGESLGVRSDDVMAHDVGGHTVAMINVCRQMPNRGTEPIERLKNAQSVRVVPVVGRAGARLLELAEAGGYLSGDGLGGANTQARLVRSWTATGMDHPFRNLRNSWQTWMRWELRVPPWAIEPIMGHRVDGVTGQHYDRPGAQLYAEVVADAYAQRPFDAKWD